jgi:Enoyl-CoA hydratase/isomerase
VKFRRARLTGEPHDASLPTSGTPIWTFFWKGPRTQTDRLWVWRHWWLDSGSWHGPVGPGSFPRSFRQRQHGDAGNRDRILPRYRRQLLPAASLGRSGHVLARQRSHIDWCFSAPTLNGIDERLAAIPGPWASDTRNTLRKLSPQSLRLTYDLLAWGKQRNLRDCLARKCS